MRMWLDFQRRRCRKGSLLLHARGKTMPGHQEKEVCIKYNASGCKQWRSAARDSHRSLLSLITRSLVVGGSDARIDAQQYVGNPGSLSLPCPQPVPRWPWYAGQQIPTPTRSQEPNGRGCTCHTGRKSAENETLSQTPPSSG